MSRRILHTESSTGWGGQEIRILREAEGMRASGHEVFLAVATGGGLIAEARKKGFTVYEMDFKKTSILSALPQLLRIIAKHKIDLVNTHSSSDAWIGGLAGKIMRKKVVRTRHLSTAIRPGLNSRLLYGRLCDFVVTTSSSIIPTIVQQAKISPSNCRCIPTGVDLSLLNVNPEEIRKFRESLNILPEDCLIGTACFVRSWKGIPDFMHAANHLREVKNLKWVVVGGGYVNDYKGIADTLNLRDRFFFTNHLESPFAAIAAMDIFGLFSTQHEGISQACLQAAYLERPLITTTIGGLPEVCLHEETGLIVPPHSPEKIADAVLKLCNQPALRTTYGKNAKRLVLSKFTFKHTLDQMQEVYDLL